MSYVSMKQPYVGGERPPPASIPMPRRVTPKVTVRTKVSAPEPNRTRALRVFGRCCFFCHVAFEPWSDQLTFDHFIPRSKGGIHRDNLVPACRECNTAKGNRLPSAHESERFHAAMRRAGLNMEFTADAQSI